MRKLKYYNMAAGIHRSSTARSSLRSHQPTNSWLLTTAVAVWSAARMYTQSALTGLSIKYTLLPWAFPLNKHRG